jgi:hypothetical protein
MRMIAYAFVRTTTTTTIIIIVIVVVTFTSVIFTG